MQLKCLLLVLLAGAGAVAHAQQLRYSAWLEAKTEVELWKDVDLTVTQMFRSDLLPYSFGQVNTELSAAYKFNKHWRAGAEYRFIQADNNQRNRYAVFAKYRDGINDFELAIRSQYQMETSRTALPEYVFRNKGSLGYELTKDLMPYIGFELFYRQYFRENNFNEYRISGGMEWELNKHNDVELFYTFSREINVSNPDLRHIFGFSYKYNW